MKTLKILFATIPFDGHFNPLTGLAQHLKNEGHDVRWYTQQVYNDKLQRMGIPLYPFKRVVQYNQYNLDDIFSDRLKFKGQIKRLNFDLQHAFIRRAPEFFEDIEDINKNFPFDVLVADVMFTAIPIVREKMKKPVISIGVLPLVENSKDLAPAGLGLTPAKSVLRKLQHAILRYLTDRILFGASHQLYRDILKSYNIDASGNTMDFLVKHSTLFLQSGTPGFEYKRSDLGKNIRYIGALLPVSQRQNQLTDIEVKARQYKKVVLVTQGTIEKDPEKLIVPAIEALKNTDTFVIVTTGGSKTEELKQRFKYKNVLIEGFIPFEEVLSFTDVFVTNGGYGGVMLSIQYQVPIVGAGVHEGKNEINARIGYFKLGINLKTETPGPALILKSVNEVISNGTYKQNVKKLGEEFRKYDSFDLSTRYILAATGHKTTTHQRSLQHQEA